MKRFFKYILEGTLLLAALLLISSIGMYMVHKALDKRTEVICKMPKTAEDPVWSQSLPAEVTDGEGSAEDEEDASEIVTDAVRLTEEERKTALIRLSLVFRGAYYGEYQLREPEEGELTREEAEEAADKMTAALSRGTGYSFRAEEIKQELLLQALPTFPEAALWRIDYSCTGANLSLYFDSRTGVFVRMYGEYNPNLVSTDADQAGSWFKALVDSGGKNKWPAAVEALTAYFEEEAEISLAADPIGSWGGREKEKVYGLEKESVAMWQWLSEGGGYGLTVVAGGKGKNSQSENQIVDMIFSTAVEAKTAQEGLIDRYPFWTRRYYESMN